VGQPGQTGRSQTEASWNTVAFILLLSESAVCAYLLMAKTYSVFE
jgi:hypothetical protein